MTTTTHLLDRDTLAVNDIAAAKSYLIIALTLCWLPLIYVIFLVLTLSKLGGARALYGPDEALPPQLLRYRILVFIPLALVAIGAFVLVVGSLIWPST